MVQVEIKHLKEPKLILQCFYFMKNLQCLSKS